MPEQVEHITRPSLPWRAGEQLTECGKPAGAVALVITRDEAIAKVKRQGKTRAAMSTCMTCWQTAEFNRDWNQSPTEVIAREAKRNYWRSEARGESRLDRELRALAALAEAHREEFDGFLEGLADAPKLDQARLKRERRRIREANHRGGGTTL